MRDRALVEGLNLAAEARHRLVGLPSQVPSSGSIGACAR